MPFQSKLAFKSNLKFKFHLVFNSAVSSLLVGGDIWTLNKHRAHICLC